MGFPFQWKIAKSGYETQLQDGVSWLAYEPSTAWVWYHPLKRHTGLYREFVKINGQVEVLEFANKYGRLGIGEGRTIKGKPGLVIWREKLADWDSEILNLRSPVMLWDAIQQNNRDYLKQAIVWSKDKKRVFYQDSRTSEVLESKRPDGSNNKYGDITWPAWQYIQDRINDALEGHASPLMLWNEDNELKLCHVPKTLLGAMWLQFADAVSYNLEYRECGWCGKSFEVTHSTRSDRLYCSNSCRVSASRKRTREAKRK